MINEGRLLSLHGVVKTHVWAFLILAVILFALGAIQLPLMVSAHLQGHSDLKTLLISVIISMLSAISLLVLKRLITPQHIYQLHENGVLVINQHTKKQRFIPFEKIIDTYSFDVKNKNNSNVNSMIFREEGHDTWHKITGNISHATQLITIIKKQQLITRGSEALQRLAQGETISFTYLSSKHNKTKYYLAGDFIKINEKNLYLSARELLTQEGKRIAITEIDCIKKELSHQTIKLLNADSEALLILGYDQLFSADLFIALLSHMIENRIPVNQ
jgi:hypothetical protein